MNGKKRQKREKKDNKRPCVPTAIVRTKSLAKIWGMVKNSVNFKREISLTEMQKKYQHRKCITRTSKLKSRAHHTTIIVLM